MRIATLSDLHTDYPENRDAVVKLAAEIHRRRADVVVVAGDVSPKLPRISRALRALREAAEIVAFVPGNHDLWGDPEPAGAPRELDTWRRYREELPAIAEEVGVHYLPRRPLILGAVAIVGSCGWYDYSLAPAWLKTAVDEEQIARKSYGPLSWSDARFVSFRDPDGEQMSDPEVARVMEAEIAEDLAEVDGLDSVTEVVAVTHHQGFQEVVTRTGSLPWEFFTSYMGSQTLGEVITASEKVRTVVHGHSHLVVEKEIRGVRVLGRPLGYPRERGELSEAELLQSRLGWIEI